MCNSLKAVFAWIPVKTLIKESQEEYYSTLGTSDSNANSTKFMEFMLLLIFNSIKEIIKTEKKVTVNVTVKVTVNQKKILEAVKVNPYITQEALVGIVGISRKSIVENMKKLQQSGLIERIGSDKNGYWHIQKK